MWTLQGEGPKEPTKANWSEWWILWRRIAAGLDRERQLALFEDVRPVLWPPPKPPPGPRPHGPVEMIKLVAALERLPPEHKKAAGELFLERARKVGSYWALGRLGARAPLQGGPDCVVGQETATAWLETLLELDWGAAAGAAFAAASIARHTGDRERDVDADLRARVAARLGDAKVPATWVDMVVRPSDLTDGDVGRMLGDSLPAGLRLS
jgi:hypothetical protein